MSEEQKPNCARPQNGWISIEKELPSYSKGFLFCIKEPVRSQRIFTGIRIPADALIVEEPMSQMVFGKELITHWMPLPELPKEESCH